MAASITKLVPSSLRLVCRPVRAQRPICSCRDRFNIQEPRVAQSLSRCLGTSSKHWQNKARNEVTEPVKTEIEEDEPDVLYKKLIIEVKGHDNAVLKSYTKFVKLATKHLKLNLTKVSSPPKHIFRQSVLKSVHIYKKHQVQYEERTHFQVYEFAKMTGSTADTFLEYIQRNLPEGVAMKVTKHRLERFPDHIKPPTNQTAQIEHSKS